MTLSLNHKQVALFLFLGSAGPLAFALISQYGFGLYPCYLCILQRIPYAAIILLAVLCWLLGHHRRFLTLYLLTAILLWLADAGIAFYHTGVEQGWIEASSGCAATAPAGDSLDDLRNAILDSPNVSCADVAAEFLGVSMAAWNGLLALSLAVTGAYVLYRIRKDLR